MVRKLRIAVMFGGLLLFWQTLSGQTDPLFIGMGIASAALVTVASIRLIEAALGNGHDGPRLHLGYFILYVAWLILQIPPAAWRIVLVILDPRRPARPGVVRFQTRLSSPVARTVLANSITLVPGTMTLNIEGNELTVHAFYPGAVADLASAQVQRRIARAFRQDYDAVPTLIWEPVHDAVTEDPS